MCTVIIKQLYGGKQRIIHLVQVKQNVPFINEMKHMEVCPVCGAFLGVNDTQTRVDAHLSGKQHVGYALIRDAIKELKVRLLSVTCFLFTPFLHVF